MATGIQTQHSLLALWCYNVQGVYVDNVPCAATPPFPIFIDHCLSLQPWQQKKTNGKTVEIPRLCVRLNERVSFLNRKSNWFQSIGWLAFTLLDSIMQLLKTLNCKTKFCYSNIIYHTKLFLFLYWANSRLKCHIAALCSMCNIMISDRNMKY